MDSTTTKAHRSDTHDVKEAALELKDNVIDVKDKLTDKLADIKQTVLERTGSAADKIRRYATANPMKAVAIAFVAGYFGMRVTRPLRWL